MKQLLATISNLASLKGDTSPTSNLQILTLTSADLPTWRAGQLTLARANASYEPYLRRAHFLLPPLTPTPSAISLIVGDDSFAQRRVGDALDLIAPIGNGFALEAGTRRLLLIGDDAPARLAPLIALAHEATRQQLAVTLLVEATTPQLAWLSSLLPLAVEYQIIPDLSTAPSDMLRWSDQLYASLEPARYASLQALIADARMMTAHGFAQVVVAPLMACGFGACLACIVETTRGRALACTQGPVFDLIELVM
jgi:dihydroorotate dehydrogenase electron transfer subunit